MKKVFFNHMMVTMDFLNKLYVDKKINTLHWLNKIRELEVELENAEKQGLISKDNLRMFMLVIECKMDEARADERIKYEDERIKRAYGL